MAAMVQDQVFGLGQLVDLYTTVVLIAVIVSWFHLPHNNAVGRFTHTLTEPVLSPIRRLIPPAAGLDFSPMILLVLLRMIRGFF
jgi:YggT family protein